MKGHREWRPLCGLRQDATTPGTQIGHVDVLEFLTRPAYWQGDSSDSEGELPGCSVGEGLPGGMEGGMINMQRARKGIGLCGAAAPCPARVTKGAGGQLWHRQPIHATRRSTLLTGSWTVVTTFRMRRSSSPETATGGTRHSVRSSIDPTSPLNRRRVGWDSRSSDGSIRRREEVRSFPQ
jgi:hypothetical protein